MVPVLKQRDVLVELVLSLPDGEMENPAYSVVGWFVVLLFS